MGLKKLTLHYAPPAKAPYRLVTIKLSYRGLPRERDLIEWLGPPARKERHVEDGNYVTMWWEGNDRAGLGVEFVLMFLNSHET
jgi:hypothetical protein